MNTHIKEIIIQIGNKTIKLELSEAKELYLELEKLFGQSRYNYQPVWIQPWWKQIDTDYDTRVSITQLQSLTM
jgi:hypothetical protein